MQDWDSSPCCVHVSGGWRALLLAAAIVLSGCVTFEQVEVPPDTLREAIRAGELVKPGDRVTVATPSLGERTLTVAEVDEDFIRGEQTEIPIEEIVFLEKRRINAWRTGAAVAGASLGLFTLWAGKQIGDAIIEVFEALIPDSDSD